MGRVEVRVAKVVMEWDILWHGIMEKLKEMRDMELSVLIHTGLQY